MRFPRFVRREEDATRKVPLKITEPRNRVETLPEGQNPARLEKVSTA